jgi:general secretion pathway protein J
VESDRGYTLLELLISILMITMIVGILAGALRLGHRSVSAGERRIEALDHLRVSIALMESQIQSRIPAAVEEEGVMKPAFRGSSDKLRMATDVSMWDGRRGYVIVTYRVETDEAGRKTLYAREKTIGTEAERETKLLERFDDISFLYFTPGLVESEDSWSAEWTDEQRTPEKIMIQLAGGTRDYTTVVRLKTSGSVMKTGSPAGGGPLYPAGGSGSVARPARPTVR